MRITRPSPSMVVPPAGVTKILFEWLPIICPPAPGEMFAAAVGKAGVVEDEIRLPGAIREQVTVQGLDLGTLVFGARLRVGGVVLEVAGPCHPCERMDQVQRGLEQALVGRRGRFVRVVEAGSFAVGDEVSLEPSAPQ